MKQPMYKGTSSLADTPLIDKRPRKPGPGRPMRSTSPSDNKFTIRVTLEETVKWQRAAIGAQRPVSDWVRSVCNAEANSHGGSLTWETIARQAVSILNSIVTTKSVGLHRSGIDACKVAVVALSGQGTRAKGRSK